MTTRTFTLLDDGRPVTCEARIEGDSVRIPGTALAALGWELHDDVLCRDTICVPAGPELAGDDTGIDLAALVRVLDRPLALDAAEGAGFLGVSARDRGAALAALHAPDFTLPDLEGREFSLSQARGRKVLLVVWASW